MANIQLYTSTTTSLSIHLSVEIWLFPCPGYCKQCCNELWIQVSLQLFLSQCICTVFILLGYMIALILGFKGISLLFCTMAISVSIPTNSGRACTIFDDGHSDHYEVTPQCNFDLHFSHDEQCCASFHAFVDPLYFFFKRTN